MRIALHVAGMALFGLVALGASYALVQWRIAHAPIPESASAGASASIEPFASLAAGAQASLALFRCDLAGNRSEAVVMLDAAKRAAQAGREAGSQAFARAETMLLRARNELADGRPRLAIRASSEAAMALGEVASEPTSSRVPPLAPYEGATLLDRYGRRIGKVLGPAGPRSLRVRVAGEERRVDAAKLVFGRPKTIGPTFVALAGR